MDPSTLGFPRQASGCPLHPHLWPWAPAVWEAELLPAWGRLPPLLGRDVPIPFWLMWSIRLWICSNPSNCKMSAGSALQEEDSFGGRWRLALTHLGPTAGLVYSYLHWFTLGLLSSPADPYNVQTRRPFFSRDVVSTKWTRTCGGKHCAQCLARLAFSMNNSCKL